MVRYRTATEKTYWPRSNNKLLRKTIRTLRFELKLLNNLLKATKDLEYSTKGSTISTVTIGLVVFSTTIARMLPDIIKIHKKDLSKLERKLKCQITRSK